MVNLLDIDVLRTFVAIAELGSFSAAAQLVGRTPSAVSMQMKKLEQQLGREMFVRKGRGITLSADGEALCSYARRIIFLNEEAVAFFTTPHLEGKVRLGTADDFATRFLPSALSRFSRAYPMVQVEVVCAMSSELISLLDQGLLDMTLVSQTATKTHSTRGVSIWSEPLVWVTHEDGDIAERRPLPLALSPINCAWRASAIKALNEADISYHVAYTSSHYAGQYAAIVSGLALAPLPVSVITPPLRALAADEMLPQLEDYEVKLLRAPGKRSDVLDCLADHIIQSFTPPHVMPLNLSGAASLGAAGTA